MSDAVRNLEELKEKIAGILGNDELATEAMEIYSQIENRGEMFGMMLIRERLTNNPDSSEKLLLKLHAEPTVALATIAFLSEMVSLLMRSVPGTGFTDETPAAEVMIFWIEVMRQKNAETRAKTEAQS